MGMGMERNTKLTESGRMVAMGKHFGCQTVAMTAGTAATTTVSN